MFEVAPSLFMVELRKKGGDTLEYHNVRIAFLMQRSILLRL